METKLLVGTGMSTDKDAYLAAKTAVTKSLGSLQGKRPIISYVFYAGEYDVNKLNAGLVEAFKGSEFVGGSADAVFFDDKMYAEGVVVASIYSEYWHVGIASSDGTSKDPYNTAKKTINEALSKLPVDKYLDPYMQFARMRKGNMRIMVKIPSFFVNVFSRGMKLPQMGEEMKIIKGISEEIGLNIPVFGGSFGTKLDKLFTGQPYEIYSLHSGKIMNDGLIVVFNSCSLQYGVSLAHGAQRTNKYGYISGVAQDGYVVTSISGKNPIDWYAEQLGVPKDKLVSNFMQMTQQFPLGIPDTYGNFMIRAGAVPANGFLAFTAPFVEGWPVYVMDAKPENILNAPKEVIKDISEYFYGNGGAAFCLAIICASCRVILQEGVVEDLKQLKAHFKSPIVGFSSFAEVGGKPGISSIVTHMDNDIFVVYDKPLHQLDK